MNLKCITGSQRGTNDIAKGGYLSYFYSEMHLAWVVGSFLRNPLITSIITTFGDGNLKTLPGNFVGDIIGIIPISKTLGSGFQNGSSFTLNLWGNQVGNTINTIVKPAENK